MVRKADGAVLRLPFSGGAWRPTTVRALGSDGGRPGPEALVSGGHLYVFAGGEQAESVEVSGAPGPPGRGPASALPRGAAGPVGHRGGRRTVLELFAITAARHAGARHRLNGLSQILHGRAPRWRAAGGPAVRRAASPVHGRPMRQRAEGARRSAAGPHPSGRARALRRAVRVPRAPRPTAGRPDPRAARRAGGDLQVRGPGERRTPAGRTCGRPKTAPRPTSR